MKYVLDASVGMKWILPEADSDRAMALQDDFEKNVHELLAPDTFPVEIAHGLTRAERRGTIQPAKSATVFSWFLMTLPEIQASLPLLPRAYDLSSQARIGVFDCLYVALAEREQCEIVTADVRLAQLFPSRTVLLSALA